MKPVLYIAAAGEIATGLALLVAPSLVGQLLLGEALAGTGIPTARVAGLALIAVGLACWRNSALLGMLFYSVVVTLYLGYLGLGGEFAGVLLWPAVVLHAVLSVLLARVWLSSETG
ncbi:hypothetical protein [Sinorhizobium sp. BG8]|uniref:hypothetical protein n=1 Tax=Sinorhizobium sp. BG8 TaxID=2613773 RepID=UPI00193CFB34|nr:hypothetical protein [Sinorhizobium sp. BG8]QRM53326.1 hypothetical protein F3Y30_01145 [Sinorhizobium sp. BG8]